MSGVVSTTSKRDSGTRKGPDLPSEALPGGAPGVWRVLASWTVGAVVAVVVALAAGVGPMHDALVAWDAGAVVYLLWLWLTNRKLDADGTAKMAVREDPTRPLTDLVLLVAAVASLGAVVSTVVEASSSKGAAQALLVALGIGSIVASWVLVHSLFSMTYARLYYTDEDGGIDFNCDEPPVWIDFAYLAFTIGMTFQVSDTELQTTGLRRVALRHMLLSYLFGAVIVAVTINIVAGLGK
jgi:uncharacterized membrane protein